jgi:hypothetical protein
VADGFLASFAKLWPGGYYEGDPRDPMGGSNYELLGYHSSLYLTYLCCIKPYVTPASTVIEIGPGRGAWTKSILESGPRHIYAVDVVAPEHAGFWDYVGRHADVTYVTATDFSLADIPDAVGDYFFSFGCFCHLRPEMCVDYVTALARKMKPGAHGFLMIADFDKFNACVRRHREWSIASGFRRRRFALVRAAYRLSLMFNRRKIILDEIEKPEAPHLRWHHWGIDRACAALMQAGFAVQERDMGVNHRDPVIHFVKI